MRSFLHAIRSNSPTSNPDESLAPAAKKKGKGLSNFLSIGLTGLKKSRSFEFGKAGSSKNWWNFSKSQENISLLKNSNSQSSTPRESSESTQDDISTLEDNLQNTSLLETSAISQRKIERTFTTLANPIIKVTDESSQSPKYFEVEDKESLKETLSSILKDDKSIQQIIAFRSTSNYSTEAELGLAKKTTMGKEFFIEHESKGTLRIPSITEDQVAQINLAKSADYAVDKRWITEEIAGYKIDVQKKQGYFVVAGKPCSPIVKEGKQEIYSLGDGRYVMPQTSVDSYANGRACRDLLLLNTGHVAIEKRDKLEVHTWDEDTGFNVREICTTIPKTTGTKPFFYQKSINKENAQDILKDLDDHMKKNESPCILYRQVPGYRSYGVMLFAIEEEKGQKQLTIWDPYFARFDKINYHDNFFTFGQEPAGNTTPSVQAVFLRKKQVP